MSTTKQPATEHGILFQAPLVRAILAGTKTETRRIVPNQHPGRVQRGALTPESRFGKVGDRLWVRETFYYDHYAFIGKPLPAQRPDDAANHLYYRADGECCQQIPECDCADGGKPHWRPSLLMPRWASRITLEITSIHAERLANCTVADAIAEGVDIDAGMPGILTSEHALMLYRTLWNSINMEPKPILKKLPGQKKPQVVGYESFPWSEEDLFFSSYWRSKHLRVAMDAQPRAEFYWKGLPLYVVANPMVWVVRFKRL